MSFTYTLCLTCNTQHCIIYIHTCVYHLLLSTVSILCLTLCVFTVGDTVGALDTGVALVETQLLTPSGSHSQQGIESYSENSFSSSTRLVTL